MHLAVLQIENDSKAMNYSKSLAFEAMSKLKLQWKTILMSQGFFCLFLKKLCALAFVSIKHVSVKYTMTACLDTQINNTDTLTRPVSIHIKKKLTI